MSEFAAEKKKVFVLEDSDFYASLIKEKLESDGTLEVVLATTLADARNILLRDRKSFSLALLDLTLPDAEGVEIVDTLQNYAVPSVVFTGSFDPNLSKAMFDRGIIDYIIKDRSWTLEYLKSVVYRLLENQRSKVLVVDDSATGRRIITGLCQRYQLKVLQAKDGVEALKAISENDDIRLVITDFQMPNMDGFELTRILREKYTKIRLPIIALSAAGNKGLSAQFIKSGANDFISKPFEPEEFFCRLSQNLDYVDRVKELDFAANHDFLTKLNNRRFFFESAAPILAGLKRRKKKAIFSMIDADHFKTVNDTYGHQVGDEVLKAIANVLQQNVRESDLLGRMGGEEFSIFAVDMDENAAEVYFNKVREAIANISIKVGSEDIRPTVSIGVVISNEGTTGDLLNYADTALYDAKESGRNCVVIKSV